MLLMRRLGAFSGVRVLTFTLMSNHFHLLCQVPRAQRVALPNGTTAVMVVTGCSGSIGLRAFCSGFSRDLPAGIWRCVVFCLSSVAPCLAENFRDSRSSLLFVNPRLPLTRHSLYQSVLSRNRNDLRTAVRI